MTCGGSRSPPALRRPARISCSSAGEFIAPSGISTSAGAGAAAARAASSAIPGSGAASIQSPISRSSRVDLADAPDAGEHAFLDVRAARAVELDADLALAQHLVDDRERRRTQVAQVDAGAATRHRRVPRLERVRELLEPLGRLLPAPPVGRVPARAACGTSPRPAVCRGPAAPRRRAGIRVRRHEWESTSPSWKLLHGRYALHRAGAMGMRRSAAAPAAPTSSCAISATYSSQARRPSIAPT